MAHGTKITPQMSTPDSIQISPSLYENPPPNGIYPFAKISEHDKVWDTHRNQQTR